MGSCSTCPAAFVVEGVDRGSRLVLCRIESTTRGERSRKAGPVSLVRQRTSPAALHGFCLGDLPAHVAEVTHEIGALATEEERRVAEMAARTGARPSHLDCPSWQAEHENRATEKLVDQPGERREYGAGVAA